MDPPNNWSRHTDEHGRTYYHDPSTGTTSWTPPSHPAQPPPPPPPEPPTAPPLSSTNSYSNSGFPGYPPAYPSPSSDYGYSYGQYPQHYSYNQHPPRSQIAHPPATSLPHPSLPHSQYPPPSSGSPQPSYPPASSSPLGLYPAAQPGAPPPHNLPPSLAPPGPPPSHAHGPPSSHPPQGPPPSHAHGPPSSHPPPGPPTSHPPSSAHPPLPPQPLPPPPSHASTSAHPPPMGGPPMGGPPPHLPPSHAPPYTPYPHHYHHQDPSASQPSSAYPSQDPYPPKDHHPSHPYPPHSSSYPTHPHMPPPHPSNPPPPPGGYTHPSAPHMQPPPPHGPPSHGPPSHGPPLHGPPLHGPPSSHPLPLPSHPPPPPPQGYPSGPDPSHPSSTSHHPPPHQSPYHPPPAHHPSAMSNLSQNASGINTAMSNMSLGLGPASKVAQINLEFRAISLRDRDWIGKSDPLLTVYEPLHPTLDAAQVSEWKVLGSTETLRNNVNPTWAKHVTTRYFFERHQPLRFDIVDVDNFKTMKGDHLGTANTTLAEIVRNGSVKLKLKNKTGGAGRGELIIRAHDSDPAGKVRLKLSFSGKGLDNKDFMGKSDPYYQFIRVMPGSAGTSTLYKSEEKKNDLNPTWKPHTLMLPVGNTPWEQVSMVVKVYDWDRYTPHDLIGEAVFTLKELTTTKVFPLINKKRKAKKGSRYKNSGELVVDRADALEMPGFISYLQGGLRLDFIVAVDFTASNRPVDNPQSLHYMGDPNQPSQYYQALNAVGTVLADYLSDGYITALGFGAKLPGGGEGAAFDFALTGQADAKVYGVRGLLDAYNTALSNVSLSGPTNFTPIIKNAMDVAKSVPLSQTNQHFAVLLILTDGMITDLSSTIDTIIEASHSTPMSIVIVGIGQADFRNMKKLDGDDYRLRNDRGDKVAKHDIVQFIKYDPAKPVEYLASDVLHEVPPRVVEFMADAGIKPNQPVMQQQLTY